MIICILFLIPDHRHLVLRLKYYTWLIVYFMLFTQTTRSYIHAMVCCLDVPQCFWLIFMWKSSSLGGGEDLFTPQFINDNPGSEAGPEPCLSSSSSLAGLVVVVWLLEQPGCTRGRQGCHAHYHITMLPGVWDWTFATRLLSSFTHWSDTCTASDDFGVDTLVV